MAKIVAKLAWTCAEIFIFCVSHGLNSPLDIVRRPRGFEKLQAANTSPSSARILHSTRRFDPFQWPSESERTSAISECTTVLTRTKHVFFVSVDPSALTTSTWHYVTADDEVRMGSRRHRRSISRRGSPSAARSNRRRCHSVTSGAYEPASIPNS